VLFVGSKPHEDLRVWYAAADVLCLATRSEGRANVLLESIACGVPVVTTHVGGNPEIVRDGRDGFLVPSGDVESLAAATELALGRAWDRDDLVAHARRQSWETTARAVLDEWAALGRPTSEIDDVTTPTAVSGSGHGR